MKNLLFLKENRSQRPKPTLEILLLEKPAQSSIQLGFDCFRPAISISLSEEQTFGMYKAAGTCNAGAYAELRTRAIKKKKKRTRAIEYVYFQGVRKQSHYENKSLFHYMLT